MTHKQPGVCIGDLVINKNHIISRQLHPPLAIVVQSIKYPPEEQAQHVKVFVFNRNNDIYIDIWPIMCLQFANEYL